VKPAREETRGKKHGGEVVLGEEVLGCGQRPAVARAPDPPSPLPGGLEALPAGAVTPRLLPAPGLQPLPPHLDGDERWRMG